jgi:enterochelin esterase-like enzyme
MRIKTIVIACSIGTINILPQNELLSQSGNTITLNFQASSATSVKILVKGLFYFLGSDTITMSKSSSGLWSRTLTDVPAGFYYYRILLDGAPVYDRASFAYLGLGTWVNGFESKDTGSYSDQKTGPFGNINENYYKSKVLNDFRKCYVYTPAEYDENPGKNYPVIYLLNDTGEDESAWIYQGKVNNILDNAINNGEIEPMLVVMLNSATTDTVLSSDLIPFIDSIYHTLDSAKYRAIAGCSAGADIALKIALKHRDQFSSLGLFSLPGSFDTSQVIIDSIKAANFNHLVLGAGINDSAYTIANRYHQLLINNSITHSWDTYSGSYNWMVWRKNLYKMLQMIY